MPVYHPGIHEKSITAAFSIPRSSRQLYTSRRVRYLVLLFILIAGVLWIPTNSLPKPKFTLNQYTPSPQLFGLFPAPDTYDEESWQDLNARAMHNLLSCMATNTCRYNQTKVVLAASFNFDIAIVGGTSGEQIWANSIVESLQDMGYTILYSPRLAVTIQLYRMVPDLVQAVILEPQEVQECFDDPRCLKAPINRLGIPFWKLFSLYWWDGTHDHPLGGRWVLSPENYHHGNFYLGYSIDRTCRRQSVVPFGERPNRAWILAKYLRYFHEPEQWISDDWFKHIHDMYGIDFVAAAQNDTDFAATLPPYTYNLGELKQEEFLSELRQSRVLIGIGNPAMSPSPYDALCLGVPFINPVLYFDENDPTDETQWISQHNFLMRIGPPYVYNVMKGDREGFEEAMEQALSTPIESYVVPEMTFEAMRARMASFLDYDWRSLGAEELAQRAAEGRDLFML